MDFIIHWAEKFLKKHRKIARYRRVFAVLAAVVVFATTYEMILPAITMDRRRAAEAPGVEIGVAAEESIDSSEAENSGEQTDDENAEAEEEADPGDSTEPSEEKSSSDPAPDSSEDGGSEDAASLYNGESSGIEADDNDRSSDDPEADSVSAEDSTADHEHKEAGEQEKSSAPSAADADHNGAEESAGDQAGAAGAAPYASTEAAVEDTGGQYENTPFTLTFEGDDYTITATFDENTNLPAGVTLDVIEILPDMIYKDADGNVLYDDYEVYLEKTVETLEKDNRLEDTYVASARFFDITFIDQEGYYVEPAAPVTIAVKYKEALSAEDTVSTVAVHFDDKKDKTEIIETEEEIKDETIKEISFDAEKFSIYGIAAAQKLETKELTASGDTYEISFSYNQKAEIPEGAKLEAYELMPRTEEYEECAARSANTDENGETTSRFFNISIMADGAEYEPKAPVDVKITLKDTAPEEVASDKEITHFTNAGEVESIPQEVEKAGEGGAEVSFRMESFSTVEVPLLGASPTSNYTIKVGGTVEITGTASSGSNSWKSSDTTIAAVSNSSTNTGTVTGVSAGTATITHTYYVGKKKTATETYTVKVEATADEITETATASDGDIQVSVKRTGSAKKFEGCTLVVEKLSSGTEFEEYAQALTDNGGDATALKGMYHIYLKDSEGNEVSVSNANMEVTITDPELEGLSNVNVGHFKKNGSGTIESKGFTDAVTTVFKKYSVSNSSITIKIQSFSVFTVSAPSTAPSGIDAYSYDYEENSIMGTNAVQSLVGAANQWQIVSGKYENNTDSQKTTSSNGKVRVQKNVIPTDVENEFLMYLSVDISRESILQEFFEGAGIVYTPSNPIKDYGEYWPSGDAEKADKAYSTNGDVGNMRSFHSVNTGDKNSSYYWTLHITAGGKTYVLHRYASSGSFNNGHIVMKVGNGWMTVGNAAKTTGSTYDININITDEVLATILTYITDVEIGTVIDTMGDGITATEIVSYKPTGGDNSAIISSDGKTINWNMVASTLGYTSDGWYTNVAELVYKIKYDPTISNGLEQGTTTVSDNASAQVNTNSNAQITYKVTTSNGSTTATQDFESPVIRGMLYEIKGTKVDEHDTSKILSGAVFTLYSDSSCTTAVKTSTTSSDGLFDFTGLQWGTYYLKETTVPSGYKTDSSGAAAITVCYTTASTDLYSLT